MGPVVDHEAVVVIDQTAFFDQLPGGVGVAAIQAVAQQEAFADGLLQGLPLMPEAVLPEATEGPEEQRQGQQETDQGDRGSGNTGSCAGI